MAQTAQSADLPGDEGARGLGRRTTAVGGLRLAGQLVKLLILVGLSMALARLLTPADFGLFAMVGTLTAFVATFRDFGLGHATLYERRLEPAQLLALFRLQARLSAGLGLAVAAAAPALAWLYGEPRLLPLTLSMALVSALAGLAVLPEALLSRGLRFGALAAGEVAALLLSALVAVGLALAGAGPWALLAQAATDLLARAALLWLLSPWRPRPAELLRPAAANLEGLIRYSRQAVLARALTYVAQNADVALVGMVGGAAPAGLYSRAYQWASMPMLQVYGSLLGLLVASLSRARDDVALFRACARRLLLPIFALCMPALAFMALAAEPFVLVLLGRQWHEAAPLLRLFCLAALAGSLLQAMKPIYLATGRTDRQLRWSLLATPLTVALVLLGLPWGATGVAVASTAASWLLAPPGVLYALRGAPLGLGDLAAILWRPAAAALGAAAALALAAPLLPAPAAAPAQHLLAAAAIYGAAYGALWLATPGGPQALRDLVRL